MNNIEFNNTLDFLNNVQEKISISNKVIIDYLKEHFPISTILGKNSYYFKSKWDDFEKSYHFTSNHDENFIKNHQYLNPHYIFKGSELNSQLATYQFDTDKKYIMYVIYDEYFQESMNLPLNQWPIHEMLIVPL